MPKNKKNKKYYLVESEKRKWSYGAFPHTEEGLAQAKKYLTELEKKDMTAEQIKMAQQYEAMFSGQFMQGGRRRF